MYELGVIADAAMALMRPSDARPFKGGNLVIYPGDPNCEHHMVQGRYTRALAEKHGKGFECDKACWYALFRSVHYCDCGRKVIVAESGMV